MTREELLKDPVYWTTELQMELYRQIEDFMQKNKLNKTQLASYLGCSKGYVSQLLSGDYDHKMSKFIELSLAIGKIPELKFTGVDEYIQMESQNFSEELLINNTSMTSIYTPDGTLNYLTAA